LTDHEAADPLFDQDRENRIEVAIDTGPEHI
jgi:hypothetical protein